MHALDNTKPIYDAFAAAGVACYIVGGAVRDQILGREIGDVDFAVETTPEQMEEILNAANIRNVRTGFSHGTITALVDDATFEVTAFRRDVKTDGRHAVTEYGGTIDQDATRRDFTMNAIYQAHDGTIIDPYDGMTDIKSKRIRFIGNAKARIIEDYLRILRYFRFIAQLSFTGDPNDHATIRALAQGLDQISGERIGQEMKKLLAASVPDQALRQMVDFGVAQLIMPPIDFTRLDRLLPFIRGDWHAVLVAAIDETPARWKLSNEQKRRIKALRSIMQSNEGAVQIGYLYGADDAKIGLALRLSRHADAGECAEINRGAQAEFPISGKDLIDKIGAGPELGRTLTRLKTYWLENDLYPTHEDLLAQLNL